MSIALCDSRFDRFRDLCALRRAQFAMALEAREPGLGDHVPAIARATQKRSTSSIVISNHTHVGYVERSAQGELLRMNPQGAGLEASEFGVRP